MSKILCIEPNVILARTYVQALEHAGYETAHARGAQEAISLADEQMPDAVLLELALASHDGIEFMHEFRSYPEWLEVPVILLTNVPPPALTPIEKQLERDLGIVSYLYKPQTSLHKLLSVVRAHTSAA
jgi:CheY-like chemotaxis protein